MYTVIGSEKLFFPRCRIWWDRYFRKYWL